MPQSNYVIVEATKTHCTKCRGPVVLLQDRDIRRTQPMFYICFECEHVVQIGRGPVFLSPTPTARQNAAMHEDSYGIAEATVEESQANEMFKDLATNGTDTVRAMDLVKLMTKIRAARPQAWAAIAAIVREVKLLK